MLEVMRERAGRHERAYVDHLAASGLQVTVIGGIGVDDAALAETLQAILEIRVGRSGAGFSFKVVASPIRPGSPVPNGSTLGEWEADKILTHAVRPTWIGVI